MTHESRPKAAPASTADQSTTFVTSAGALSVRWTIEARCHLLAAARILELDPHRSHQARHVFGLAARIEVAA